MKKHLLIPLFLLFALNTNAQTTGCDSIINLADTVSMCAFTPYVFNTSIGGTDSVLNVYWTPGIGFSDSTIVNPTLTTPGISTTYYFTINALADTNYVVNGNFTQGNVGFTTGYTFVPNLATSLNTPGNFTITQNPNIDNVSSVSFSDHTRDFSGLPFPISMFAVNGLSNIPTMVWQETVAVTPNTNYAFSAWFANWLGIDTVAAGAPLLQFEINGTFLDRPIVFNYTPGVWHRKYVLWNSGPSTTAVLTIFDSSISGVGNAFAIDDIALQPFCTTVDSTYFVISKPDSTYYKHDTSVCNNISSIKLTGAQGYSFYNWSNGVKTDTNTVTSTNTYVGYSYQSCAVRIDTFHATFIPIPVNIIPKMDTFCQYDSLIFKSVQDTTVTFLWSTGSTADSIIVKNAGIYTLIMNNQGCIKYDTFYVKEYPTPLVKLGPDTASCNGIPVKLQSLYTYDGTATYLWSSGWTVFDTVVALTGTYWLQVSDSGCVSRDTINVQVSFDSVGFHMTDTVAICKGTAYQTLVGANPAASFQWIPTTGISAANIAAPLISTDTSAWYKLTVSYGRCPIILDSFYLDVQPNPAVYIGGYRNICQFDTIHINASVKPPFPGYTYSWSPSVNLDNSTTGNVVFSSSFALTDTTTLHLYVSTSGGCTGQDSAYIYSHPGNFLYMNPDISICPGVSVQLLDSGAIGYRWYPGLYLSDSLIDTPVVTPVTSLTYTLIGTSIYGCQDTLTMNVTVFPNAFVSLQDSIVIFPGQTVELTPFTNCVNFQWFPPDGLSRSDVSNPTTQPTENTQYVVVASTNNSCVATDTVNIVINHTSLIAVPNAFTPGRGVNSVLYIMKNGLATLNFFRIFDRWGNKVFETNNIEQGWDGTYNGATQPFGVYVYELQAVTNTGQLYYRTGNITLIK